MKTRCRRCAPSGIHRGSIMQLRTAMLAQMPTLMSRMAITCTIQQRRAGTTQQVSAHQTSRSSTTPYPAPWPKLRVGEPKSQEPVISLHFDREHSFFLADFFPGSRCISRNVDVEGSFWLRYSELSLMWS